MKPEDAEKWNNNCARSEELAELIKQLQIEMTVLDGSKIKADLLTLMKAAPNLVTKEDTERITDDVKKFRIEIADSSYEIQSVKDSI